MLGIEDGNHLQMGMQTRYTVVSDVAAQ